MRAADVQKIMPDSSTYIGHRAPIYDHKFPFYKKMFKQVCLRHMERP